ncbi:MAG: tripartite tricarboxylate transporter TctB family protein [Rhodospirillales bacterium]
MSLRNREQIVFLILVAALFAGVLYMSLGFDPKARYFPFFVGSAFLVLSLAELARTYFIDIKRGGEEVATVDAEGPMSNAPLVQRFPYVLPLLLWLAGYYAGIYLIGFLIATVLFLFFFLRLVARLSLMWSAASSIIVGSALYGFAMAMALEWPRGLLEQTLGFDIG